MTDNSSELNIDARGLRCPLPLLRAKQALNQLRAGQSVTVLATDPGSVKDFHAFSAVSGHSLNRFEERGNEYIYTLVKRTD